MSWPPDPKYIYELWVEPPSSYGRSHAYVTAQPRDRRGGCRYRFAIRLDLPGEYSSKSDAAADGFAKARRFFRNRLVGSELEVAKNVKGYLITAHARFRIDCHAWQPVLWIKSDRPVNRGATQAFDGLNSPLAERTFPTAKAAADFAFSYGERLVLGLIGGLHI